MAANFSIGDLVTFDYSRGTQVHDRTPRVLCLHNNWRGCVHGLNFNYLTEQEINYVKAVINPAFELEIVKRDRRIAMQMQRIANLSNLNITSPHDFYLRWVKGFIQPRGWDPYRRYNVEKINAARILTRKSIMTGEEKDSLFNRYAQKFQHMLGPRLGRDSETQDYSTPRQTPTTTRPSLLPASPSATPTSFPKKPTGLADL